MSECCSSGRNTITVNKANCPKSGNKCSSVSEDTILKHIKSPWDWKNKKQNYFFCDDPDCDVVYFGEDKSVINQSEIRASVGIKDKSNNALVCYCFGITKQNIHSNPSIKDFVIKQIKEKTCACEYLNPSGKCCLKDFPK